MYTDWLKYTTKRKKLQVNFGIERCVHYKWKSSSMMTYFTRVCIFNRRHVPNSNNGG